MRTRTRTRAGTTLVTAAVLACAAACTGSGGDRDSGQPPFVAAPQTVACQEHQAGRPGPEYTSEQDGDTAKIMGVLEHYTANGRKPFCDGKAPTATDRAWARLYIDLGADPAYLPTALGGTGTPDEDPTPAP
ncbi:hypothetical protein [Embleya sp. NBC_00896]|uniref:hypothetical protein n=1 Tax=Embleya sp. NBC_00896 TaxID=2975961 RepID=UPI002F919565|nr:hypothetical protein OG928_35980 [Embleya sp. NBC_00896]